MIGLAEHVAQMGDVKFIRCGRTGRRWKDNIKVLLE